MFKRSKPTRILQYYTRNNNKKATIKIQILNNEIDQVTQDNITLICILSAIGKENKWLSNKKTFLPPPQVIQAVYRRLLIILQYSRQQLILHQSLQCCHYFLKKQIPQQRSGIAWISWKKYRISKLWSDTNNHMWLSHFCTM